MLSKIDNSNTCCLSNILHYLCIKNRMPIDCCDENGNNIRIGAVRQIELGGMVMTHSRFHKSLVLMLVLALLLSIVPVASAEDVPTLKVWIPLLWAGKTMDYTENDAFTKIQENLGIKIEFVTPALGSEYEQFNIMVTGGSMADIIFTGWSGFNGLFTEGADAYIEGGYILRLNELVDEYAPNYKHAITEILPEAERKAVYSDKGNLYQFGCISPYEEYAWMGLLIREEFLQELGMDKPETIEEYEEVLRAFKDELGCTAPLLFPGIEGTSGYFMTAFGIAPGWYQKDGEVLYGYTQPEFKDYLELMHRWYEEGLLYADFMTYDTEVEQRLITTGMTGMITQSPATVNAWLGGQGKMVVAKYPVLNSGDEVHYRMVNRQLASGFGAVITTACKDVEAAVRFLDYGYSEEGFMLYNYGIEGETYTLTGNKLEFGGFEYPEIAYTDKMMNNPEYGLMDAILKFKLHAGPYIRFENQANPTLDKSTLAVLKEITDGADTLWTLPPIAYTAEEQEVNSEIMTMINTYQNAAIFEFIMGVRDLSEFDDYVATIEGMGLEDVKANVETALERYNAR